MVLITENYLSILSYLIYFWQVAGERIKRDGVRKINLNGRVREMEAGSNRHIWLSKWRGFFWGQFKLFVTFLIDGPYMFRANTNDWSK